MTALLAEPVGQLVNRVVAEQTVAPQLPAIAKSPGEVTAGARLAGQIHTLDVNGERSFGHAPITSPVRVAAADDSTLSHAANSRYRPALRTGGRRRRLAGVVSPAGRP